jgi:hypothetical protein
MNSLLRHPACGTAQNVAMLCLSFSRHSSRSSKAHALASNVFVNEFDSGRFKCLPNGSLVCGGNRNFAVNDLNSPDCCYADF